MKQCEECGMEYEENLKRCPHCTDMALDAEVRRESRLLRAFWIVAGILVLVAVLVAVYILWPGRHAPARSTAGASAHRASSSQAVATTATAPPPIQGDVIVTITITKKQMGPVVALDVAHRVGTVVLQSFPSASTVAVFDSESTLLDTVKR